MDSSMVLLWALERVHCNCLENSHLYIRHISRTGLKEDASKCENIFGWTTALVIWERSEKILTLKEYQHPLDLDALWKREMKKHVQMFNGDLKGK